jgi:hypothetical protein
MGVSHQHAGQALGNALFVLAETCASPEDVFKCAVCLKNIEDI